jgi:catechol 2,3-dioxygenase-like lactoylglutathione lyase family enzyme
VDEMITTISLAGVWVKDQEAAKEFYVDKLGFKVQTDIVMKNGYRWLEVIPSEGKTALALARPYLGQKDASIGVFANIVLGCDDITETCKELRSKGVKFVEEPNKQEWGMMQALFEDIDGNVFVLVER